MQSKYQKPDGKPVPIEQFVALIAKNNLLTQGNADLIRCP